MKQVNEYIYLDSFKEDHIRESSCFTTQDELYLHIQYYLSDQDCLFDFSKINNRVYLRISKSYFEKYDEGFEISVEKQKICCNTQAKLNELIQCNHQGLVRKVFLESIVLYLLFQIQKNSLLFQTNCDSCSFINKPMELDKIQKAKDYIVNNLDQNLTIPVVASQVGTNQCYLKKGFKEIVGQTIFEFVQENRMVKSRFLLRNSDQPIQDIAFQVGYSSLSSFSQTYKNYFGISPNQDQKSNITNN